jgi:hypothetical protein
VVNQECAGNAEAAEEIVQGISQENQVGHGTPARRRRPAAVVPVKKLLEGEKSCEAAEKPDTSTWWGPMEPFSGRGAR